MPIVAGVGMSYSPVLYRPRAQWGRLYKTMCKDAVQPRGAVEEDAARLDEYQLRVEAGFRALDAFVASKKLDALIVVSADRGHQFDSSNVPQLHVQVGGEIWGNPANADLGEPSSQFGFKCEETAAEGMSEELVRAGFDIAEARRGFRPIGDPERGLTPAAAEAVWRIARDLPIIPISINCHVRPILSAGRMHAFGRTLARAASSCSKRLGVLASGGLSGDPDGPMAGWVDDVFDRWVLRRLASGNSQDLIRVWDVESQNLLSGTIETRLWMVMAAAMEAADCEATV